jgi:hypothetical protein
LECWAVAFAFIWWMARHRLPPFDRPNRASFRTRDTVEMWRSTKATVWARDAPARAISMTFARFSGVTGRRSFGLTDGGVTAAG